MLTIETRVAVGEDGCLTVQLPGGVRPGVYRVVVVLRDAERPAASPSGDVGGTEIGDIVGTDDTQSAAFEAVYARAAGGGAKRG